MILCRVQHHPSRADLIPSLLKALDPLYVEVSEHSSIPPDPWAGYKQCLSNLPDCSHVLVIQDDAQPASNFAGALQKIAERHIDTPVCLFLGSVPGSTAAAVRRQLKSKPNERYVPIYNTPFVPLVCVLWPKEKAQEFLSWASYNKTTRADDANVARWMKRVKQPFFVTVPSLVQHNDGIPSVKGGREHKPWAESWRQALFLAEDASDYEW